jgi:hypothetical protein
VLLLLCWVPEAPIAGAWTAGLSLGSGNRRWGCATVEPGASVDSQAALCGCTVCGFTPREDVTLILGYLRMRAGPLHSLDCSTFAPSACSAAVMTAAQRGGGGLPATEVAKNRQQNMKAVQ